MKPAEMSALLSKQPFEPFRIHLDDGRVIDIHYPRLNMVCQFFSLGVPMYPNPDPIVADHFENIGWDEIVKCEPLNSVATS